MTNLRFGRHTCVSLDIDYYDCLRQFNFGKMQPIEFSFVIENPFPQFRVFFQMTIACDSKDHPVVKLEDSVNDFILLLEPCRATKSDNASHTKNDCFGLISMLILTNWICRPRNAYIQQFRLTN